MWELLQLGCDVVAAGCSLMAVMGFVAFVGWLFGAHVEDVLPSEASSPRFVSQRQRQREVEALHQVCMTLAG
jgi:hypothetical protein